MSSIKELLDASVDNDMNTHLAAERDHFVRNLHHPNGGIGISAFLNKQKPQYKS